MRCVIAVVLLCVTVAYAQFPTPCYAPRLFEARMMEDDPSKEFLLRAKMSYDASNRRVRLIEEVNLHDKKDFYDTIYLYNFGIEYVINLRTKKCEKKRLTRQFRDIHIPSNATFYGELYLGDSLLTQTWGGNTNDGGRYHLLWTVHECLPVSETYLSNRTGFVNTVFFDVTLGISDPNVFIPPRECR